MEFQTSGDGHAEGLAEFDANDELETGRPGIAYHGAANAVVAADADDVTGSEAMASAKGDAVCGGVNHLHAGVASLAALVSPGNRQLAGRGFTRFRTAVE